MAQQRLGLLAAASLIAIAAHAKAQTAAPTTGVEDIVVTAQSRAQHLQKVPISIVAFDAKFIKKTNARTLADLQRFTPGLTVDNTSVTQPVYTIRGIAGSSFGIGTDPAVGIYIDGVYSARSGESLIFFDDLDRVEILKGPQGTLFGRNTAAGAISIITKKPTQKLEGTIDYTYGNYDKSEAKLILNIPVTDTFAVRLDGVINRRNGWIENYNGSLLNNEHNDSGRLSMRWTPTTDDEIIFAWDHDSTSVAPPTAMPLLVYPVNSTSLYNGTPVNPYSSVHDAEINGHESRMLDGLTLTAKHDFGNYSITSISAYKNFNSQNLESENGSSNFNRYFDTENVETNHNFYQELRINGIWNNLTYVAGTSFFYERAKQSSVATTSTQSADIAFGVPLFQIVSGATGDNVMNKYYQEQMNNLGQYTAWSVFGDATYALTSHCGFTRYR